MMAKVVKHCIIQGLLFYTRIIEKKNTCVSQQVLALSIPLKFLGISQLLNSLKYKLFHICLPKFLLGSSTVSEITYLIQNSKRYKRSWQLEF